MSKVIWRVGMSLFESMYEFVCQSLRNFEGLCLSNESKSIWYFECSWIGLFFFESISKFVWKVGMSFFEFMFKSIWKVGLSLFESVFEFVWKIGLFFFEFEFVWKNCLSFIEYVFEFVCQSFKTLKICI